MESGPEDLDCIPEHDCLHQTAKAMNGRAELMKATLVNTPVS